VTDAPLAPVVPPTPGDPQVGPVGSPARPYVEFPTDPVIKLKWAGNPVAIVSIAPSYQRALALQDADPGSDGFVVPRDVRFDPPYTDGTIYSQPAPPPPLSPPVTIPNSQYKTTGIYFTGQSNSPLPEELLEPSQGAWLDYYVAAWFTSDSVLDDLLNPTPAIWLASGPPSPGQYPIDYKPYGTPLAQVVGAVAPGGFTGTRIVDLSSITSPVGQVASYVVQYFNPSFTTPVDAGPQGEIQWLLVNFANVKTVDVVQPGAQITQIGYSNIVSTPGITNVSFPHGLPPLSRDLSSTDYEIAAAVPATVPSGNCIVTVKVYNGGTFEVNSDGSVINVGGTLAWSDSRTIADATAPLASGALATFNASKFTYPPP